MVEILRRRWLVEAILSYWLSWYVQSSGAEDGLNLYVFSLAILIVKGVQFAIAPLYLGPPYSRLEECGGNCEVLERYNVVTSSAFLGEVPLSCTKTHGVSHSDCGENNTDRQLHGNETLKPA